MTMRKLDLGAKAPAPDPMEAVYSTSAPEGVPAAPKLTPRTVLLRVKARNPETGEVEVVEIESTAPDSGARLRMGQAAVKLAGGVSLPLMAPGDALYLTWLARIGVQCSEIPKESRWILSDPNTVAGLVEALLEHEQRYFRGELAEDGGDPFAPVVERPWSRTDSAGAPSLG